MKTIKAIAIDLDGTLLRDDKTISSSNLDAIMEAQRKGICIIIASGRPTYGVQPIANALKLQQYGGYILAYNGGEIYEWRTQRTIYDNILNHKILPYIYQTAKDNGLELLTYHNKFVVAEDAFNPYVQRSSRSNRMEIKAVDNFLEEVKYDVVKCMIVGEPEKLKNLEQNVALKLSGVATVFRSEPFYLEIVPPLIDKGRCLALLMNELDINPEQLLAFGDGYNDISMLEYAGHGYAMDNAPEAVKRYAKYIAPANEVDGVAQIIRKYLSSQ